MRWTTAAIASSILAGCGKVSAPALPPDGGPSQPTVEDVDPAPGAVAAGPIFRACVPITFDQGGVISPLERSECPILSARTGNGSCKTHGEPAPLSRRQTRPP